MKWYVKAGYWHQFMASPTFDLTWGTILIVTSNSTSFFGFGVVSRYNLFPNTDAYSINVCSPVYFLCWILIDKGQPREAAKMVLSESIVCVRWRKEKGGKNISSQYGALRDHAWLWIEIWCSMIWMRFDWGWSVVGQMMWWKRFFTKGRNVPEISQQKMNVWWLGLWLCGYALLLMWVLGFDIGGLVLDWWLVVTTSAMTWHGGSGTGSMIVDWLAMMLVLYTFWSW